MSGLYDDGDGFTFMSLFIVILICVIVCVGLALAIRSYQPHHEPPRQSVTLCPCPTPP